MSITLPGSEGLLRERAFALLDRTGREGLEFQDLARELDAEPDELRSALRGLEARGRAVEVEEQWYAADRTPWEVGIVELLETGDALLRPGWRQEPTVFLRRRQLKGALHGDTVLVRRMGRKAGAEDWKLPEGSVLKILSHRFETLVGTLSTDGEGRRWLEPYDPKLPVELEVLEVEQVPEGHYVVVQVERGAKPLGHVVEDLGNLETPGTDVKVVLRHYGIPDQFPAAVEEAAAAHPPDPGPGDWAGREDLRDQTIFTIDGVTARDFDDAVSIERLPNRTFRLGVHIADVAHYVREGAPIDLEAYRRGTSVYYPDRAIPMLPEGLSNGLCSLRPGVPRLTLSVFLDIDRDGHVQNRRFAETVIQSARRMTYDEVRRILDEPQPGDLEEYGPILLALREMRLLMNILHHRRLQRGSIDFDLPEGSVELSTEGNVVGIIPTQRHVAHRIIEEFMIAANEAVAYELEMQGIPALYRVHDQPDPDRLADLRDTLQPLGIDLRGNFDALHPSMLQGVLGEVAGTAVEGFVSSVVLRTMQRALYSPECRGHYALASRYYTHFTSPIRRYPDLVVHRALKALLHGRVAEHAEIAGRLTDMGEHTSRTERRAEQSERDLLQWKKVRFLADRVGDTFRGRITGVQPFGLFVQLEEIYVDGLVPIRTLGDDYYVYHSDSHRLVGERTRRVFRLADAVEVVLTGVNLRHRGLDFRIVGMPEAPARPDWPRPKERAAEGQRGRRGERDGSRDEGRERRKRR